MRAKYLIVIEKGTSNFSAYSPDVPGCVATGRSVEKTLDEMRAALSFHLEGVIEHGEPVPVPRSLNSYIHETNEISGDDILTSIEIDIPELALA